MNPPLQNKVVLVTGGARRVGAAIARRLHAAGARIAIHYRGSEDDAVALEAALNALRPDSAVRFRADLLEADAPAALVRDVSARLGGIDGLVNNASLFYPTPMGGIGMHQWDELMGSNVRAPLFLSQAAAPMLAAARGAIVNIVDIHAERPLKDYPVYSAAKAALAGLTRALAVELAPAVRVNGVSPGAIVWPEDGQFDPAERERVLASTPLARVGGAEEIAQAVQYLLEAQYVTGQILAVDGGRSVYL